MLSELVAKWTVGKIPGEFDKCPVRPKIGMSLIITKPKLVRLARKAHLPSLTHKLESTLEECSIELP